MEEFTPLWPQRFGYRALQKGKLKNEDEDDIQYDYARPLLEKAYDLASNPESLEKECFEKDSLCELKQLLEDDDARKGGAEKAVIWGIALLGDERSDVVLLKFLWARNFNAKEAMVMIKNTLKWRREFWIDGLVNEKLSVPGLEEVVFMHGTDRMGHPVCYNLFGELGDEDRPSMASLDDKVGHRVRVVMWRIQFLENVIRRLLDFSPGGVSKMLHVIDFKSHPSKLSDELREALSSIRDNYPGIFVNEVFINVPWWYLTLSRIISPFIPHMNCKGVLATPSESAETLFKYIAPEEVPIQFGGLSNESNLDFTNSDVATEITVKPSTKQVIVLPVTEASELVWEIRVLGWEVTYDSEFVPSLEDAYPVIIHKPKKLSASHDPVVKESFKFGETGKVLLTVKNATSKKKMLIFRYKAKGW